MRSQSARSAEQRPAGGNSASKPITDESSRNRSPRLRPGPTDHRRSEQRAARDNLTGRDTTSVFVFLAGPGGTLASNRRLSICARFERFLLRAVLRRSVPSIPSTRDIARSTGERLPSTVGRVPAARAYGGVGRTLAGTRDDRRRCAAGAGEALAAVVANGNSSDSVPVLPGDPPGRVLPGSAQTDVRPARSGEVVPGDRRSPPGHRGGDASWTIGRSPTHMPRWMHRGRRLRLASRHLRRRRPSEIAGAESDGGVRIGVAGRAGPKTQR